MATNIAIVVKMIGGLAYSRVAQGNLTPRLSQVGSNVGAVLTSPFPTPATTNPACGFWEEVLTSDATL